MLVTGSAVVFPSFMLACAMGYVYISASVVFCYCCHLYIHALGRRFAEPSNNMYNYNTCDFLHHDYTQRRNAIRI